MRVLHIINNLGSGGAEKLLKEMLPIINKKQHIYIELLLLTDRNSVFLESLTNNNVKVTIIRYKKLYDPRNIFRICNIIKKGEFDIVHSHLFPTQLWVAISKLVLVNNKTKFITTEHSTHNRRRNKICFKFVDKFIYSQYDVIISISEKTRENLLKWINPIENRTKKYIVIENGVNLKKIKESIPFRKKDLIKDIDDSIKLVCMIGRFTAAKDQQTLIKAMRNLPLNYELILIGEGPLMGENIELAKQLGLLDRIHFLGFRNDIYRILKAVDIAVLSSNWEGFGLSAIEGMAAGKPVIISDVDGLNNVVIDIDLKFKPKDYNELSKIILKLGNDKEYYYEKSQKALIRSEKFNLDRVINEYIEVYSELIQTKKNM